MSDPAVFLDRDGTIIEHYDYLTDESEVALMAGATEALRLLRRRGYKLVMITNQSGVARGKLTERKLLAIHDYLRRLLADQGAFLDKIYYCPYHPEAPVEQYRRESELRKPAPGMLKLAEKELNIDLSKSWMVGDDDRDIEAGRAAGCRTLLLEGRGSALVRRGGAVPDFRAKTILEAANLIARYGEDAADADEPEQVEPGLEPVISEPSAENVIEFSENETTYFAEPAHEATQAQIAEANPISEDDHSVPSAGSPYLPVGESHAIPHDTTELSDHAESSIARPNHTIREAEIARRKSHISPSTKSKSHSSDVEAETNVPAETGSQVETTLREILREMKTANRERSLGSDFSIAKLMGVISQMLVMGLLIMAFVFYSDSEEPNALAVHGCLLLAVVFQILTLTVVLWSRRD